MKVRSIADNVKIQIVFVGIFCMNICVLKSFVRDACPIFKQKTRNRSVSMIQSAIWRHFSVIQMGFPLIRKPEWNMNPSLPLTHMSPSENDVRDLPGESRPKRTKAQQLAAKVLASIFRGIIFAHYLEGGKTVTRKYLCSIIRSFEEKNQRGNSACGEKKLLFNQANALA